MVNHEYLALFFLTFGSYLNYIDRSLTFTLLPTFGTQFDIDKSTQGVLSSSFLIGYAISSIIFCIMTHKIEPRKILSIGCIIWCVSCLLMFTSNLSAMFIGRILSGVGEAAYQTIVPAYIETKLPSEENKARVPIYLAIYFSGIYVGSSFGIILGGLMYKYWKYAYLLEMFLMLPTIIYLMWSSNNDRDFQPQAVNCKKIKDIIKHIFINPLWWLVVLAYTTFTFTSGAVSTWMPTFVSTKFPDKSFESLQIQLGLVIMFASIISAIVTGFPIKSLAKKYPSFYLTINSAATLILFILSLVPLFGCLYATSWIPFILSVFVFIFIVTSTNLPINLLLLNVVSTDVPEAKNYSMALSICIMHLGGDIPSPIIIGSIWDATKNAIISIEYSTIGVILSSIIFVIVTFKFWKMEKNIPNTNCDSDGDIRHINNYSELNEESDDTGL